MTSPLKLSFSPDDPGCVILSTRISRPDGSFLVGTNYRARLDIGSGVAHGCRARLMEVSRDGEVLASNLVLPLKLAPREFPDLDRYLCAGVSEFIDVVFVQDDGTVHLWTPGWPSNLPPLGAPGAHHFKIAATSSAGAALLEFDVVSVASDDTVVTAFPFASANRR